MNYQKTILVSNATSDAESRTSKKDDLAYTTFSVAVSDGKDRTAYFPVVAFGKLAALAESYITKGREVLVEGRIEVSDKRYFNVVADKIQLGAPTGEQPKRTRKAK